MDKNRVSGERVNKPHTTGNTTGIAHEAQDRKHADWHLHSVVMDLLLDYVLIRLPQACSHNIM